MPHILCLCLRSYQMPPEFTGLLGDLLQYAKYAIKTANGVSADTYSHSPDLPVFGSGQGSTVSATGWGKLVSIALDMHDKQRFGSHYSDPQGMFKTIIGMLGFVDDNNISNTGEKHESIEDVIKRTQHDAQLWNDILKSTGGTLNLLKCFFQVITTTFSRNGAPVIAAHDKSWYIDIVDQTDNSTQRVKAISAYTPYKSLGTIQGICTKQDDQFEVQLAKATRLSRALACSNVSAKCAFIHWNACFVASIAFPLGVCHMSTTQLHDLQKKYVPIVLNKMGFPRTYPQAIVFGPTTHGGIGSIDLRIEQGIMGVTEIIRTLRTPGHGQDIVRIFLRTFQHASGMSLPLLEYPGQRAPHLEGHYYVQLRKFLAEHKLQLECACVDHPVLERDHDFFLMDKVCEKTKEELSDANVRIINYCRNYLEVRRLSDICTADGQFISQSVWDGDLCITQSQSRLDEIIQEKPGKKEWTHWRNFLKPLCYAKSRRLIRGLGQWTTTIHTSERAWQFYYSRFTGILYRRREDWNDKSDHTKYKFDKHHCNEAACFPFTPSGPPVEIKQMPSDSVPVDIARNSDGWLICHFHVLKPQPATPVNVPPTDLTHFIQSQPEYISQYYANIKWEVPEDEVYKILKDTKTIILGTDGGAKAFKGSIGFVITDAKHRSLISCYGCTAGHDPLSFRTEASAFLAALRMVFLIAEYYKEEPTGLLTTGKDMTLFTDSMSMVNKLNAMNEYPTAHLKCTMDPEWDVLQAIHTAMDKMKEKPELEWVRSHQDDDEVSELDQAAQLNIKADALATQGLNTLDSRPKVPMDPTSEVLLHHRGRTITRDYKVSIRNNIQLLVLEKYYQKRFGWTNTLYGKIDWSIFSPVYRREQNKNKKWINKWCMRKLPVGQRLHAREEKHDARCCSCWHDSETDDHLLQCPKRARHRNEIYAAFKRLGKEMDPVLSDILLDGVTKYLNGTTQTQFIVGSNRKKKPDYWDKIREVRGDTPDDKEHNYWQLQRNQDAIGWDNLLRGKFAKDWRKLNSEYHRKQNENQQAQEEIRAEQEEEEQKPKKHKADVFQRVFKAITAIIRELWLERNMDRHQPIKGQQRMAKITEATRTVTDLYTLRTLVLPEHESKYFAMPLEEMVGQSASRMLAWATRWKVGIYQSVRRAKLAAKDKTVPIWKIWDHDRIDKPVKRIDRSRITQTKQKRYKPARITNKLKVTESKRSTSRVSEPVILKKYVQARFDDLEEVIMEKNDALYGDAFND